MRRSVVTASGPHYRAALIRPPKETCTEQFCHFFWDERKKTCMTRTPLNWLSIFVYYVIFVIAVILILYLSLEITFYTASIHGDKPQYILENSPIGISPGINYFPIDGGRPVIRLTSSNKTNKRYADLINKTLEEYRKKDPYFNRGHLGACANPPFGYDSKSPCIYFRLNRLFDWIPNPYINGNVLPEDMPKEVRAIIESEPIPKVWLFCEGSTAKDRDHITQEFFQWQGSKGFDTSPFPFTGQHNFMDPIVAIKLVDNNPRKMLYSFSCSAWSKKLDSKVSKVQLAYYFD